MTVIRYTCGCGRAVEELVNITPGLVRPGECARCWVRRTGTKKDIEAMEQTKDQIEALSTNKTAMHRAFFDTVAFEPIDPVVLDTIHEGLEKARQEAEAFLTQLQSFEITTSEEMDVFGTMLTELKDKATAVRERMESITRPLRVRLDATREFFKPSLETLELAETILKQRLLAGRAAIERQNAAATAAIEQASATGDTLAVAAAAQGLQSTAMPEGTHTRKTWDYSVIDLTAVPREFLALDTKKIRKHIAEHGDSKPISGILIKQKEIVVAK